MEKTDAQIEKEKQAVAAMANAKSNMAAALERISTLERVLNAALNDFGSVKYHVGEQSKIEYGGSSRYVKTWISDRVAEHSKALP